MEYCHYLWSIPPLVPHELGNLFNTDTSFKLLFLMIKKSCLAASMSAIFVFNSSHEDNPTTKSLGRFINDSASGIIPCKNAHGIQILQNITPIPQQRGLIFQSQIGKYMLLQLSFCLTPYYRLA